MNLIERAKLYKNGVAVLSEWLGEGAITVEPALAQSRASGCLVCPLNVKDWPITEAMADAIKHQVEIKNNLELRVEGEKSLHTCKGCGCINRLKIWLPLKNILPEPDERKNFDVNCWLLSESAESK